MNKKRFVVLCLTGAILCALALPASSGGETDGLVFPSLAQESLRGTQATEEFWDPGSFMALFRHLNQIKKQADKFQKVRKDGSGFRRRFQKVLVVDDDQFEQLNKIALEWGSTVAELDKKAAAAIELFRARYPAGKIPEAELVPPPPAVILITRPLYITIKPMWERRSMTQTI